MNAEVVTVPQNDMIALLEKAISNPEVDPSKLNELLNFQIRMMDKQAEIEFNAAFARLQPLLPVIEKKGTIKFDSNKFGNVKQPYAKYEDIDRAIRPLLNAEGFSLSFNSETSDRATTYSGTLSHRLGHSKTVQTPPFPADTTGSKNAIQALGSTMSYAKRYLVMMLLNIVTKDLDDDGNSFDLITDEQIMEIEKLLTDTNADKERFLKYIGVNALSEITARDFEKSISIIKQTRSKAKK